MGEIISRMTEKFQREAYQNALFLFLALGVFATAYLFFINHVEAVADEPGHCRQIAGILLGTDRFPIQCPYLPIYHWSLVILYWVTHFHTPTINEFLPHCDPKSIFFFPSMMRLFSTGLAFACFTSFFFLAKSIHKDSAYQKSSLFLFFPLTFPFFFLIYTDIYAMLYVLLAFALAMNQRLWLAGIVGILSCLVRQNNIIWLIFIGWIVYCESYYPQYRWKDIKPWIGKFSFFFLAIILMIAFVIWNKGFIVADRAHHYVALNFDYVFFMLFLFFFLFLPQNLANAKKMLPFLQQHKWMGWILAGLYFIYLFFFRAAHEYNSYQLFLHNNLLGWMRSPSALNRTLAFLPIAYSIVSLCVTPLQRKSFRWLYPFTLLFIIPSVVIEIRYLFIPFTLFILFRERDSERMFLITLIFYMLGVATLTAAISARFFP